MRVAWLLATAACTAAYRAPFPRPRAPRASSVRLCEEPAELPLPAGWKQAEAPDGRTYYYLRGGKETQWERPTEPAGAAAAPDEEVAPPLDAADVSGLYTSLRKRQQLHLTLPLPLPLILTLPLTLTLALSITPPGTCHRRGGRGP